MKLMVLQFLLTRPALKHFVYPKRRVNYKSENVSVHGGGVINLPPRLR